MRQKKLGNARHRPLFRAVASESKENEQVSFKPYNLSLGVYRHFQEDLADKLCPNADALHSNNMSSKAGTHSTAQIETELSSIRNIEDQVSNAVSPDASVFQKVHAVKLPELTPCRNPLHSPTKIVLKSDRKKSTPFGSSNSGAIAVEHENLLPEFVPADKIMTQKMLRDRALVIFARFQAELARETEQSQRLQVASTYMEHVIEEFKLQAPLLSAIKLVYHEVCDSIILEKEEIRQLKTQLLRMIGKANEKLDAKHNLQETCKFLKYENENLQRQKTALENRLKALARKVPMKRDDRLPNHRELESSAENPIADRAQKIFSTDNVDVDTLKALQSQNSDEIQSSFSDSIKNDCGQEEIAVESLSESSSRESLRD